MRYSFLFLALIFGSRGMSQGQSTPYDRIDNYVLELGPLEQLNVATITDTITYAYTEKESKARAIYSWIAHYIELDAKATRAGDNKNTEPETVIKLRKSTSLGIATLFQEMCSQSGIRCLVVDGYHKFSTEQFNEIPETPNYSWNVIQLGQSSGPWYYVDVTEASGYLDKKMTSFTRKYSGSYFFPSKNIFNLEHFPDNAAWRFGEGPATLREFYALPLIGEGAYQTGLLKPNPSFGHFKTKTGSANIFSFKTDNTASISNVSIVLGEGSKQQKPERVNFTTKGNEISFNYVFRKEEVLPMKILVEGSDCLTYLVEAEE